MRGSIANARIGLAVGTVTVVVLLFCSPSWAGQTTVAGAAASSPSASGETKQAATLSNPTGVEVLTDTQGVDFGPYIRSALSAIKKNWLPLIPEEARPPANVQGETL